MKALILAAGYATRLYPLTKQFPKPLLKVEKRPIIDYILDKLQGLSDIDEIMVVTNSKFISPFRQWAKTKKTQRRIEIIDDLTRNHTDRRGAIGDMLFVLQQKRLQDDLLIIGGDNLFDSDLNDFISFAKKNRPHPVIGVYDITDLSHASKYGIVKLDAKKRIVDFKEKPKVAKSTLVAMCLYYFPKERLNLIKEYLNLKTGKHDASGLYIDWLRKKVTVYGFLFQGRWYDIGDHHFYHSVKGNFTKKQEGCNGNA